MKTQQTDANVRVEGIPVSVLAAKKRRARYGTVPGLTLEELADPEELERQVFVQEWGPVLSLPVRGRGCPIQPNIDEFFGVDWGAFGTVDFERSMPAFDKARYKADRLKEELRDVIIMMETLSDRLPKAKALVLKYLDMGIIDLDHIEDFDMYQMARLYLRAKRLQGKICTLGGVGGETLLTAVLR